MKSHIESKPVNHRKSKIRYAVVGLGYIAQKAVLPAFEHARKNSELTALVSNDPLKLKEMGRKFRVSNLYSYDQYDDCLQSGHIDAVYIALPNNLHREYAERAAVRGIHVLCEKPMSVTEEDCESMIRAAKSRNVKLMIAYRLHFEEANLKAIEIARSGKIGDVRIFNSAFTMDVKKGDIRLQKKLGGGTLYDIGIYCINAARCLFGAEPESVFACSTRGKDPRFKQVDEMTSAILRFPGDRFANFVTSFGASDVSTYRVIGTEGELVMEPAYEYAEELKMRLTVGRKSREIRFPMRDQFAPELIYFSDCILHDRSPEPSGEEGLADVRVIRALQQSVDSGKFEKLPHFERKQRPTPEQEMKLPPVGKQTLVHAEPPSR